MTEQKKKTPRPETGGAITRELLESDLAAVRKQKESALTVLRQAEGAEYVLTSLLGRLDG